MDFYQTFEPTSDTSHYFTSGGAALLNDPYAEVGKCAAAVGANAVLQHELSVPKEQRKQCTRFLRLAAQDDVDATRTEVLWKALPTPLHEEAVRSMLGRGGLTSKDLSRIPHCEGAKFIKNVMASAGCDDCPFCPEGRESRYHWRHECAQAADGFLRMYQAVSKDLATAGPAFWFDPTRRIDPSSTDANRPAAWWTARGIRTKIPDDTGLTWDFQTPDQYKHRSSISPTQARVLADLWQGTQPQVFARQTYDVLLEAIQRSAHNDCLFDVAMACPPEIKRWVRTHS